MRQIRYTLNDFIPEGESGAPDAVMSPEDLAEIQRLAGMISKREFIESKEENMSHTAMKRVEYMKKHKIQPGTDEWFRLWFSRPYLTGKSGMEK